MKLLGELNKVKGVKNIKELMRVVSMHKVSRTKESMAIFPIAREHYARRIIKKNAFREIIHPPAARMNNLHHFCVSLLLTSTDTRWNCSCNLQLLYLQLLDLLAQTATFLSCVCQLII